MWSEFRAGCWKEWESRSAQAVGGILGHCWRIIGWILRMCRLCESVMVDKRDR